MGAFLAYVKNIELTDWEQNVPENLRSFGHFLLQVSAESIILNWMGVFLVNPSPSDIVFPMYMISISTDTTQITTMKRSDLETKVAQGLNKCLCTRQHLMLRLDECSVVAGQD
jgi:hypothetical protein